MKTAEALQGNIRFEDLPDLIPPDLFSKYTGQCVQTVRRQCKEGKLPSVQCGRRMFVVKNLFGAMCGLVGGGVAHE